MCSSACPSHGTQLESFIQTPDNSPGVFCQHGLGQASCSQALLSLTSSLFVKRQLNTTPLPWAVLCSCFYVQPLSSPSLALSVPAKCLSCCSLSTGASYLSRARLLLKIPGAPSCPPRLGLCTASLSALGPELTSEERPKLLCLRQHHRLSAPHLVRHEGGD